MKPNVPLIESIVRLVLTMVFAILAVYTDMFIFMIIALALTVTAIAQWCPINRFMGRNKNMSH